MIDDRVIIAVRLTANLEKRAANLCGGAKGPEACGCLLPLFMIETYRSLSRDTFKSAPQFCEMVPSAFH